MTRTDLIDFSIKMLEIAIRDTRAELHAAYRAYHTERKDMLHERLDQQKAELAELKAGRIPETMLKILGA